jgi:signal transduction histidine kinase
MGLFTNRSFTRLPKPLKPMADRSPNPAEEHRARTGLRVALVAGAILLISAAHYFTDTQNHLHHAVFRRLYYLPIFVSALWFGLKGGLGASIASSVLYAPHILFQWKILPSMELEKYLEIILFNVVGALTGLLAEIANRRRDLYRKTSEELEGAYRDLQQRSAQLSRVEKKLRQSEKLSALGELSATVAHEVMNPLGSIKGAAEILKDDFPDGHEKHSFLAILVKEIDRLDRTVRNVLRFRSHERIARSACDPKDLIETILILTEGEARSRGIEFHRELSRDDRPLSVDPDKIHQVFLNLVMNAIQAMPEGGRLTVTSGWTDAVPEGVQDEPREGTSGVLFMFEDTGIGIPEDAMADLFEPFRTTKEEGTGLGLVVAKRIVEAHGGTIRIRSRPGSGTCFQVWLPGSPVE